MVEPGYKELPGWVNVFMMVLRFLMFLLLLGLPMWTFAWSSWSLDFNPAANVIEVLRSPGTVKNQKGTLSGSTFSMLLEIQWITQLHCITCIYSNSSTEVSNFECHGIQIVVLATICWFLLFFALFLRADLFVHCFGFRKCNKNMCVSTFYTWLYRQRPFCIYIQVLLIYIYIHMLYKL